MDNNSESGLRHGITGPARARAVAAYMIAHNDKHIDELADLVDGLDKDAGRILLEAIGSFEVGNTLLRQLLERLDSLP